MIFVGVLSQLIQVINTHAKFKFKRFGILFACDLKALRKKLLRLIQILVGSEICFAEQAIYFGRVKAFGVLFIEPFAWRKNSNAWS